MGRGAFTLGEASLAAQTATVLILEIANLTEFRVCIQRSSHRFALIDLFGRSNSYGRIPPSL